jgi:hypothetical protein
MVLFEINSAPPPRAKWCSFVLEGGHAQLLQSPMTRSLFPMSHPIPHFKAVVCATTLHPFHNLEQVWQVKENCNTH